MKDYDDWLKRLYVFPQWVDTAIYNMRKGIATGYVLPKTLAIKILPQLKAVIAASDTASIFYGPIKAMPDSFSAENKARLVASFSKAIDSIVNPGYSKLYDFFEKEYLPKTRATSGVDNLPGGKDYYRYCIRYWTTTDLSEDSIYNIGLREVARIEGEMNKVKDQVGFKGDMQAFFKYLNTDTGFSLLQKINRYWIVSGE